MILQLRYSNHTTLPVKAACIRGHATDWLKEISRWNLPVDELECYVLPRSIQSIEAVGLFVIFKNATAAIELNLLEPYTSIEEKLFIPVNAMLVPEVSKEELKNILRWSRQVFHPVTGLVGFEAKDAIALAALFFYKDPVQQDWSFAHPGILTRPAFTYINVEQPSAEELIEDIRKRIGQKPLNEIPESKEGEPSALEKAADTIKYGLLKGIHNLLNQVDKLLPAANGSHGNVQSGEGMLQKLQHWLTQNMDELEKKRNNEIKRLLRLFEDDTNEALQYAISLNSPYLNRGSQTVSSTLSRRPLNFNLGKLGGGQVVDNWNVGDYYNDLRTKYLKAAQKEIERKDFKKAAYVYAHLLGDYHAAANVLEQGGMYREAATLHKDHLKNIPAAAQCLERGALYHEAIDLYKALKQDEKIGDLYTSLQQQQQAEAYYEKHIEHKIFNNDYLDAARVMDEKLQEKERAKEALLKGWGQSYQHESCLKKYFNILLETNSDAAEQKATDIFANHTPKHKRLAFLNVLEYVKDKKKEEDFTAAAQEIAYQVVHDEIEEGNVQALHHLKNFLPGDKMIGSDTSRYLNNKRNISVQSNTIKGFQLDESISWIKAIAHRNQFLVLGIKNNNLHLIRANWYGNMEYYSWTNDIEPYTNFNFIDAPYYSNHVIIHASFGIPITRKNLPKNKYFPDALIVNCPIWLHKGAAQFIINEQEQICKLEIAQGIMMLHYYSIEGDLKRTVNCSFENSASSFGNIASFPHMVNNKGHYYSYKDRQFIAVSEEGIAKIYEFNTIIRFFAASGSLSKFWVIISTNKGCYLCSPQANELNRHDGIFAEEITPSAISFIAAHRFVIIEKTKAFLFEIKDEVPVMLEQINTKTNIISALPTHVQYQFALLEENGNITLCERDE